MIGGHPEKVLRHDVRAPPHGKHRPRGELRAVDGDIAGGIADAKDEDALSGKGLWGAVVVGMELLAGECAGAGGGRFGLGHRGPELYFPAESEMIHEVVTVPRDDRMA